MAHSVLQPLAQRLRGGPGLGLCLRMAYRSAGGNANGKRQFFQRINEQHLAHSLEKLSVEAHMGGDSDPNRAEQAMFDPKMDVRSSRKLRPTFPHGRSAEDAEVRKGGAYGREGEDFKGTQRRKPWLNYESLRGETYPLIGGGKAKSSGSKGGPRWQDLTHNEAQRLQEMYMRKRMLDRKIMWLKSEDLPNPQKEAKLTIRRQKKFEEAATKEAAGDLGLLYPPPFMDVHPESPRYVRMEEKAREEELESRFRSRIRVQKLENARLLKTPAPQVGDFLTDPIQRHVQRRLVRQRAKIHAGIEMFFTRNTSQILHEHLQGATVSIAKVFAKRPRATQQIYYNLTSDHDPASVQRQLDTLAPKLRSQFAVKVNMGQTPNFRFVPMVNPREVRRKALWGLVGRRVQQSIRPGTLAASLAAKKASSGSTVAPSAGAVHMG